VETITRIGWPTLAFPSLVERWLDQYEPDIVWFKVNPYWYNYESVPLKLERAMGRFGRPMRAIRRGAPKIDWLANSWPYRFSRWLGDRTIGGATYFTIGEVLARVDETIRVIVAHEEIGLVVRGTAGGRHKARRTKGAYARREARRLQVHHALAALCAEHHVIYNGREAPLNRDEETALVGQDAFHRGTEGHLETGLLEGAVLVEAWRQLTGRTAALPQSRTSTASSAEAAPGVSTAR
jgi:hypothetical protein